jgi:3'(2'), 5'-bisphosphate nucleotidase
MEDLKNFKLEKIKEIARKAGDEVMKYYKKRYNISYKKGDKNTPLTEADLASEEIIKEQLQKLGIPILSEEAVDDSDRLNSKYVFIVDPLDGTSDFIDKTDEFSIMIGLAKNEKPILGVAFEPAKKTMYFAEKGKGAFMEKNGEVRQMKISDKNNFKDMTILLSRNHLLESDVKLCESLEIGRQVKRGSTSKMCVIARGEAEIYVNTSDKTGEWDTCAVEAILSEAGGKVTDMDGNDLVYNKEVPKNLNGFVASNSKRHDKIVKELRKII